MARKLLGAAAAVAIGFTGFAAGPVLAAESSETAVKSDKKAKDPSKRVCRNLVLSGSRMTTRFCRTQADWDRDAEKAQRDHLDSRLNGSSRDGEMNKPK